ncbi:UNVERIFIED_CONTAM: hypothetical protein K2H54_057195 [Gekko kuhli]
MRCSTNLVPEKATQTVSLFQSAELVAKIKHEKNTDILWKRNGSFYQTTDKGEVKGNQFTLSLPSVRVADGGVYSASFMGDSPLSSASYRLIVRGEMVQRRLYNFSKP